MTANRRPPPRFAIVLLVILLLVAAGLRRSGAQPVEEIRSSLISQLGAEIALPDLSAAIDAVMRAGDLDGDGKDEFVLRLCTGFCGALLPGPDSPVAEEGELIAAIVYGSERLEGSIPFEDLGDLLTMVRKSTPERVGAGERLRAVRAAGDLDDDGYDDLCVFYSGGAPDSQEPVPEIAWIIYGSPALRETRELLLEPTRSPFRIGSLSASAPVESGLASDLATGGDFDGDGRGDILFGAQGFEGSPGEGEYGTGALFIVLGGLPSDGELAIEDLDTVRIAGASDGDLFGHRVEFAGDLNDDGFTEILVTAPSVYSVPGSAYLIYGSGDLPAQVSIEDLVDEGQAAQFVGLAAAAFLGSSLAAGEDWTGDGIPDFLVGASSEGPEVEHTRRGAIYLLPGHGDYSGVLRLKDLVDARQATVFRGEPETPGGSVGVFTTGTGADLATLDYDGDGHGDILTNASNLRVDSVDVAGTAYVLSDPVFDRGEQDLSAVRGGDLRGTIVTADAPIRLGKTVDALGDVNGDGFEDFALTQEFSYWELLGFEAADAHSKVFIVFGNGGQRRDLLVERIEPRLASLGGGEVVTVLGSGFDESTTVEIAGRPASIVARKTSARLEIVVPPGEALGDADVLVRRDDRFRVLPGGLTYVVDRLPDIDVEKLEEGRAGLNLRWARRDSTGISALGMEFTGDRFDDIVLTIRARANVLLDTDFIIVSGREDLEELTRWTRPEDAITEATGISVIHFPPLDANVAFRIGDITGDNNDELALTSTGKVQIIPGSSPLPRELSSDDLEQLGFSHSIEIGADGFVDQVLGGEDLNGDGLPDMVLMTSSPSFEPSRITLVPGRASWPRSAALEELSAPIEVDIPDLLGTLSAAMFHDLNDDGFGDFAFTTQEGTTGIGGRSRTVVYVKLGHSGIFEEAEFSFDGSYVSTGFQTWLGWPIDNCGDFNDDGFPELGISEPRRGLAYLLHGGKTFRPEVDVDLRTLDDSSGLRILSEPGNGAIGAIAPAGDFNGDGVADVSVGWGAVPASRAYVVFGRPGSEEIRLADLGRRGQRLVGSDELPINPAGYGDFNGDGFTDLLVTRFRSDVAIVFGHGDPVPLLRGDANGDGVADVSDAIAILTRLFVGGASLQCRAAGDTNGDGLHDISDAIRLLRYLFLGEEPPVAPFPDCAFSTLAGDLRLGCSRPPRNCR